MYSWLIFLHVLGVFAFLLAHGASANTGFALRKERNLERVRALLLLSANSYQVMYPALLVIVITGIVMGFLSNWWKFGWIWLSLATLIVLLVAMYIMGSSAYALARKAVGLPYFSNGKFQPPQPVASAEEIDKALNRANPLALALLGYVGLGILAGLMIFKPF